MTKRLKKTYQILRKNKPVVVLFLVLFGINIFFRVYQLEERAQFTWDQVDTAWTAKNMIVNHVFPVTGMPAKQNAAISNGPAYYYFIAIFYLLTNLDPIASPLAATVVGLFSSIILFIIAKKLFNTYVALIALFVNAFSFYFILQDRIQWPVGFVAPLGLLIFYSLYKIIHGNTKYLLLLAIALGASFHVHFTSVFYLVILVLMLPLFPRKKETIRYALLGLLLFGIWLIPFAITAYQKSNALNLFEFLRQNSIGLHLRRVIQVADTAFLEPSLMLGVQVIEILKYLIVPIFLVVIYLDKKRKNFNFIYLTVVWFLVPWISLSLFAGDLTQYYFASTRYVSLIILSFLFYKLITFNKFSIPVLAILAGIFILVNSSQFFNYKTDGLSHEKKITEKNFKEFRGNEFVYGAAQSYIYYFYQWREFGKK